MSHHTTKHREDKISLLATHVSGGQLMLVHLDVEETVYMWCENGSSYINEVNFCISLLDFEVA